MALFLDSADTGLLEPLLETGLFAGVATNPTLLARAGLGQQHVPGLYAWAVRRGARTVFAQTLGTDPASIAAAGRQLAQLGPAAVVKVPATQAGLTAARMLADEEIPVLVTAVHHAAQALAAAAAGAAYVAPYVGRMTDAGRDGVRTTAQLHAIAAQHGVRVLAASVRSVDDVAALAVAGVPDFALPPPVAAALLSDEPTVLAAAAFEEVAAAAEPAG